MLKIVSRAAITAASVGLVIAPIAAHANTRAGDSTTIYSQSSVSQPGVVNSGASEQRLGGDNDDELIAVLAALLATIGVLIAIDDADDQSPGT